MKTITVDGVKFVSEADYNAKKSTTQKVKTIKGDEIPFEIGGKYFFRTVTYFATGEVEDIKGNFLVLKNGAWIADTGRFSNALATGVLDEVEPVEVPMYLNMNTITDAFVWKFDLPNNVK